MQVLMYVVVTKQIELTLLETEMTLLHDYLLILAQSLHNDILRKKPDFLELTEVAGALMALVGEDEASGLAFKLQDMTDRYAALVGASENLGQLLQQSRAGLRHLVLTYQDLQAWMEGMEHRLAKYRVLAVHTDKLLEQMDDLAVKILIYKLCKHY